MKAVDKFISGFSKNVKIDTQLIEGGMYVSCVVDIKCYDGEIYSACKSSHMLDICKMKDPKKVAMMYEKHLRSTLKKKEQEVCRE